MARNDFVPMDGKHIARAADHTYDKQNGKFFIKVRFAIEEGPFAGQSVYWRGYFTDAAADRTMLALRYCGWEGDDIGTIDNLHVNQVELDCKSESWVDSESGETQWTNKVDWVNRPSRLVAKNPLAAGELQAFAAQLRGKAIASRQKLQGGAPGPTQGFTAPARPALPQPRPAVRPPQHQQPDDGYASGDPGPSDADVGF